MTVTKHISAFLLRNFINLTISGINHIIQHILPLQNNSSSTGNVPNVSTSNRSTGSSGSHVRWIIDPSSVQDGDGNRSQGTDEL
jgi:hypothetical protein